MNKIKEIETKLENCNHNHNYNNNNHMSEIETILNNNWKTKGHPSVSELLYWFIRGLLLLSFIVFVIFIFYHD